MQLYKENTSHLCHDKCISYAR